MLVAASPYLFAAGVIASFVPALRAGEWIRQLPEPYGARVYDVGSRCTRITNDRTKPGGCSRGHGNAATARDAPTSRRVVVDRPSGAQLVQGIAERLIAG